MGEVAWTKEYVSACGAEYVQLWNDFHDRQVFEERHGRRNMVLENAFLVKYKAHWSPKMLKD